MGFDKRFFYCLFVVFILHRKKKIKSKQQMQLVEDPTSPLLMCRWHLGSQPSMNVCVNESM